MTQRILSRTLMALVALGTLNAAAVDFESEIRPLLKKHCFQCHGPKKQANGLRLDAKSFAFRGGESGPAIVPSASQTSDLLRRIASKDEEDRMPPEGPALQPSEQELIKKWIDEGAAWVETDEDRAALRDPRKDHWAWQPIRNTTPPLAAPASKDASLSSPSHGNEIDLFLNAERNKLGLTQSPEADRRTLIRRLSFDLLGLPPTPEQVSAFELDTDKRAYENLVDRLLDSPHYGERSAQHWLDIAHYADTHGFERDQIREHAWRYRDWVIQSFNSDMPFEDFIRKQIAGDALAPDDPASVIATGFLAAGPWDFVGQAETPSPVLRRLARADDLDDMITQVMAATTAVTINCARCHDHKLDPISQREYYSISSVFAGTKRGNRAVSVALEKKQNEEKAALAGEILELKKQIQSLTAKGWDLADIVGGGHGLGTGQAAAGIDPNSGSSIKDTRGFLEDAVPNRFNESPLPIIDGVSVPDGKDHGSLVVSSTGIKANNLPATSGKAWDAIRNGPVHSQFSTKLRDVEYNDGAHKLLSLHANALITFDLTELPQIPSDNVVQKTDRKLRGEVGYFGQTPKDGASAFVLLDGEVVFKREQFGRNDGMMTIDIAIPDSGRFLTLIAADSGNGISHDQICFSDLRIEPLEASATNKKSDTESQQEAKVASLKQELDTLSKRLASFSETEKVYAVVSEAPPKMTVLARGDTEQPREAVQSGAIDCVAGLSNFSLPDSASDFDRRLQLAHWVTNNANPLTWRVIVNRIWQQHFGVGIVSTPSDFGLGGSLPSHPELLDWLAMELKNRKQSIKEIHRLICCSAAYRQQSQFQSTSDQHAKAIAVDSSNRFLWRQNSRKLDAESLRDSLLSVSGQLDSRMFGPGFREFDYKEEYAPVYSYVTKNERELFRRSIYRFRVRTTPNPLLTTLDCPNSANLTPTRNTTTTALQSLALLNHDFLLQQSKSFANRLERADSNLAKQVSLAWSLVFSREPLDSERDAAQDLIQKHGLATFSRYLLNANEFVSID